MKKTYPQHVFEAPCGATTVVLVRHGQSAAADLENPARSIDGHSDPELSALGERQAEAVGQRLRSEPIDAVYVTKLQRTAQTAAPLVRHLAVQPTVQPDLHEIFLGDWEGGIMRKMSAEQHPTFTKMISDGEWGHAPGAETTQALADRTVPALGQIHHDHPGGRVAVFVHGGVIAALLHHATGARPFAFLGADNGSIHNLVLDGDRWLLRQYNDVTHLAHLS